MLVHDPNFLEGFPGDKIIITPWTIDELDKLKRSEGERGQHALQALRKIHEYSAGGDLFHGIVMKNGSTLKAESAVNIPMGTEHSAANKNIYLAKRLMKECTQTVIIISKNISLRIQASMLEVRSGDYEGEKSIHDPYAIFPGCSEIPLKSSGLMTELHRSGSIHADVVERMADFDTRLLIPNQCVRFVYEDKETLAVYKRSINGFRLVPKPSKTNGNGKAASFYVAPKNCEQAFAYSLLMDPEIKLVALVGSAGSGKTLMSLLAAKEHVKSEFERDHVESEVNGIRICDQIIVFRPNVEMGNPLGFLPGDLEEKFEPWEYPILDNLDLILHNQETRKGEKKIDPVRHFIESGMIQISPINHVRGRSLHYKFIIIDEAQNLTPHQARSLITRTGKGSKVILTGDISQIDYPYLDQTSNGLSHVISRFMGQEIFGYTIMKRSEERSLLAKLASDLL